MVQYRLREKAPEPSEDKLRPLMVDSGLPSLDDLNNEIQQMYDVLLDRVKLPIDYKNSIALMEIADTFYCRANEIKFLIYRFERSDPVQARTTKYTKFRTSELESFLETCKRSIDTGSRRLSAQQFEFEKSIRGLAGWGSG